MAFLVSSYRQNNQEQLENIQQKFAIRISESLENFYSNLKLVKERTDQKLKDDEQKMVDKFEKWVNKIKFKKQIFL